jgi:hypothetical protein
MAKRKREAKVEKLGIKVFDEISFLDGKKFYKSFEMDGNIYSMNSFILTKSIDSSMPEVRMITRIFVKEKQAFIFGYWLRTAYGKYHDLITLRYFGSKRKSCHI